MGHVLGSESGAMIWAINYDIHWVQISAHGFGLLILLYIIDTYFTKSNI